jgi:hypothetical protein
VRIRPPGSNEKEPEGREIASFECKLSSESAPMATIPGSIAVFAALASSLDERVYIVLLLVLAGLLPVVIALVGSMVPRTKGKCTIKENGIGLKSLSGRSKARFFPWRGLSRFSSKALGIKGGRIYLYPRGPFSLFRRVAIEPLVMSDYQLLYNHVSSRVGLY